MASYYRRFIQNFAAIAEPLINLTRKNVAFQWESDQQKAFDELKLCLVNAPILGHFDSKLPVYLYTDASRKGLGAVCCQMESDTERVIAYASKSLNKSQRNYGVTELELLAVVWAFEKFHFYVGNNHEVLVYTDHAAIAGLLRTKDPVGRLSRWIIRMSPYRYKIIYRPGKQNCVADALSRFPVEIDETDANACLFAFNSEVDMVKLQREDPICSKIVEVLETESPTEKKRRKSLFYCLVNRVLYRRVFRDGKPVLLMVVPTKMIPTVIESAHDSEFGGHQGIQRTYAKINDHYYFPGAVNKVTQWVISCESCQRKKDPKEKPPGFMQPLRVKGPFVRIHVDYCGPFLSTKRHNKYIILAICPLTKYIVAWAVPAATAACSAKFLSVAIVASHGCFEELLTDRGTHFTGEVLQKYLQSMHIKHSKTSAYHPQTDGQAERALQTVVTSLSHFVSDHQKDWDLLLPFVVFALNTSKSETTGYTPFELVHGRSPNLPIDLVTKYDGLELITDQDTYFKRIKAWLDNARANALEKVNSTHDKEAPRFNAKRSEKTFEVGDLVLLWSPVTPVGLIPKLCRKWKGPYRVVKQTSPVNYEIETLIGRKIKRQIVHIERLKNYHERVDEELLIDTDGVSPGEIPDQMVDGPSNDTPHLSELFEEEPLTSRSKRVVKPPTRLIETCFAEPCFVVFEQMEDESDRISITAGSEFGDEGANRHVWKCACGIVSHSEPLNAGKIEALPNLHRSCEAVIDGGTKGEHGCKNPATDIPVQRASGRKVYLCRMHLKLQLLHKFCPRCHQARNKLPQLGWIQCKSGEHLYHFGCYKNDGPGICPHCDSKPVGWPGIGFKPADPSVADDSVIASTSGCDLPNRESIPGTVAVPVATHVVESVGAVEPLQRPITVPFFFDKSPAKEVIVSGARLVDRSRNRTEEQSLTLAAETVCPSLQVTPEVVEAMKNALGSHPALKTLWGLTDTVCSGCHHVVQMASGSMLLQSVIEPTKLFGLEMGSNECCAPISLDNGESVAVTVRNCTTYPGQCEARITTAENWPMYCPKPHQSIGVHHENVHRAVYLCPEHLQEAVNHGICVCGDFPYDKNQRDIRICAGGHVYHQRCAVHEGCPPKPCARSPPRLHCQAAGKVPRHTEKPQRNHSYGMDKGPKTGLKSRTFHRK